MLEDFNRIVSVCAGGKQEKTSGGRLLAVYSTEGGSGNSVCIDAERIVQKAADIAAVLPFKHQFFHRVRKFQLVQIIRYRQQLQIPVCGLCPFCRLYRREIADRGFAGATLGHRGIFC